MRRFIYPVELTYIMVDQYAKLPKIVKFLEKKSPSSMNAISDHINSDIRTTKKMMSTLSDLKLVKESNFNSGKKTFHSYSLAKGQLNPGGKKYGRR